MFKKYWLYFGFSYRDKLQGTGKSLSEALISASTNPQYDDRLFIELQVQYMKIPSSNLWRTCCVQKLFLTFRTIFVHNMFSPCSATRRASDKDLPVFINFIECVKYLVFQLFSEQGKKQIKKLYLDARAQNRTNFFLVFS